METSLDNERLIVTIDKALKKTFHMVCIYDGVNMSEKIEELLTVYTDKKLKEMQIIQPE